MVMEADGVWSSEKREWRLEGEGRLSSHRSFYAEVCAVCSGIICYLRRKLSDANRFVSGRFKRFTIILRTQIQLTPPSLTAPYILRFVR